MKMNTKLKAGKIMRNHNATVCSLKCRTNVKAGRIALNHCVTVR